LRANEQGDDAPLPAFKGMRLINWLSAVIWAGEQLIDRNIPAPKW